MYYSFSSNVEKWLLLAEGLLPLLVTLWSLLFTVVMSHAKQKLALSGESNYGMIGQVQEQ